MNGLNFINLGGRGFSNGKKKLIFFLIQTGKNMIFMEISDTKI